MDKPYTITNVEVNIEDSNYDESRSLVVCGDIVFHHKQNDIRLNKIRIDLFAQILVDILKKSVVSEMRISENLWDTGEYVGLKRRENGTYLLEFPVGKEPLNYDLENLVELALDLQKITLSSISSIF